MKTPTLRQKVEMYEAFLHKINMAQTCGNSAMMQKLIRRADTWSYAHRVGNGTLSEKEQQQHINDTFWKLTDTDSI